MADQDGKQTSGCKKRQFVCQYAGCGSKFLKRAHLDRHELIHNDSRPYQCKYSGCDKAFRSKSHVKRHEATHSGEKNFKCSYEDCNVTCVTEWNLRRHIKRTHLGPFKCDRCGEEFKKNKAFKEHYSLMHKNSTICCSFPGCGNVFNTPSKMKHHMKTHASKGYICSVEGCSLSFRLWSECRQHTATCPKRKTRCDVCGKIFTEKSNLKEHIKVHSEEREVFQCNYEGCGRFYTKAYNLKVHVQSFHQNIRPYVCTKDFCKKSFHLKHLLLRHLENHPSKTTLDAQKERKEMRKVKRRMVTPLASGLSGDIPKLWGKIENQDVAAYVDDEQLAPTECIVDTSDPELDGDYSYSGDETTQAEKTPLVSSSSGISIADEFYSCDKIRFNTETMSKPMGSDLVENSGTESDNFSEETVSALSDMEITDYDASTWLPCDPVAVVRNQISKSNRSSSSCSTETSLRTRNYDNVRQSADNAIEEHGYSSCATAHLSEISDSDGEMQSRIQLLMEKA